MTQNAAALGLVAVLFAGLILAFCRTEKHLRESRIRRRLEGEPLVGGSKIPGWLIELYEATFRPDK